MSVLLINTCGLEGVVALGDDQGIVAQERLPGRGTSETLIPALRRLLAVAGDAKLGVVGVVQGPGSFTGVRVGLSAAKGLCEARAAAMVAMSRLRLVAGDTGAAAVLDAGRGQFYCGYGAGEGWREEILEGAAVRALLATAGGVTCEARVQAALPEVRLREEPGAEAMLAEVRRRSTARDWTDVATADAHYLRRTDAELLVEGK